MKTVLVSVVLLVLAFLVVRFVVRVAVGFLRWARAHRGEAAEWAFFSYAQHSLGEWVDDVSSSPPWFPFEGSGHHDGGNWTGGGSSHDGGGCGGGDGGGMCE